MTSDRMMSSTTRVLIAGGIVGPLVFVATFMVEGANTAGYDPMRVPVSLLSLTDRGIVQVLSFLVTGALVVGCAVGLRRIFAGGRAGRAGPVAVGVAGVGLLLAGLFSADPSFGYPSGAPPGVGPAPSARAYVHVAGAFLFFGGLIVASWLFAARFRAEGRSGWAASSAVSGVTVLLFLGLSSGGPDGVPLFPAYTGLFQRIAIITGLGWLVALAVAIVAGSLRPAEATAEPAAPG
jgi:Protein of unknown function (DUF998)